MKNAIHKNFRVIFALVVVLTISGFEMTTDLRPSSANVPFESPIQPDIQEQPSQTFTVTSTANTGAGTLRTAIDNANANPGLDTIAFNIGAGGFQGIFVTTPLPAVTDPVNIDGSTQPGYAGQPLIEFFSSGQPFTSVINITGGNSTVRGLKFSFFSGMSAGQGIIRLASNNNVVTACGSGNGNTQVVIDGGSNNRIGGSVPGDRNVWFGNSSQVDIVIVKGATATGNRIIGNWFGTDFAGAISRNIGKNILIDNAPNNFVGGTIGTTPGGACTGECNLISGATEGVRITGAAATGNTVIGNYFGTDVSGTGSNRNDTTIRLVNAPNNRIGGSTPAARNVMGAAFDIHIFIEAGSNGTIITGNYIGVKTDGASAFTGVSITAQQGIRVLSNNNHIGGVTAGERNVISGSQYNIYVFGGFNLIQGNYIGTNATGTAGLTTSRDGILLEGPDNTIGTVEGTSPQVCTGGCNLISGNGPAAANNGIFILGPTATRNVIAYNYIGLNATGTAAIRNGLPPFGHSILIIGASGNTIGRASASVSRPTPISLRPETSFCIEDDGKGSFAVYDDQTGEYFAKNCVTGETFEDPPLGVVSIIPPALTLFLSPKIAIYRNAAGSAAGSLGNPGQLSYSGFKDSNIFDNGPCECLTPSGEQTIAGSMDSDDDDDDEHPEGGTPGNKVMNNYIGVTSDLSTVLSVIDEPGIKVTNGSGSSFVNNFVVTRNKPAYELTINNSITGGSHFTSTSVAPILTPQTNVPNMTGQLSADSFTFVGSFSGEPLKEYKIQIFGVDPIDGSPPIKAYRFIEIEFNVTTAANGNASINKTFDGIEAQILMTPDSLAATATKFGDVPGPGEPYSPAGIGPISTSVMSPPITVVTGTPTPTPTPTNTPTPTPTATPTSTPTPTPGPGFEGDVAPRFDGDGIVLSTDVTQMRRFVTGLDTPDPRFNEVERADSAPRSTFGDGITNSGDVIQARRYAAGLDPLTAAGGPTAQPPALPLDALTAGLNELYAYLFGREIRVGVVEAKYDRVIAVPIEITAHGDETAIGFTLEYDPAKLGKPTITLVDGAPDGFVLTVNDENSGRIGILIDSPEPITASAMPVRIVTVTFEIADEAIGDAVISFGNDLAAKAVSDSFGKTLSTRWLDGMVVIGRRE